MSRLTTSVAAVVAAASILAQPVLAGDAEDIAAIWDAYEAARVAGDADAWLALWDEGGVPKAFAAMPASAMEISPVETVVMGDWAFSRGTYTADLTSGGNAVHVDGKFMTIFRRQDDGSWKIYRDIFNSNS